MMLQAALLPAASPAIDENLGQRPRVLCWSPAWPDAMLPFVLGGIEGSLNGVRQDSPPKLNGVDYDVIVETDESDQRIELLHENLQKYGTIDNTLADATVLGGTFRRETA